MPFLFLGSFPSSLQLTSIQGVLLHTFPLPISPSPLETISAPNLSREYSLSWIRSNTGSKEYPIYSCVFSSDGEVVAAASQAQARVRGPLGITL